MATFFACLPDTIRKEWLFPGLSAAQGIYSFGLCGFFVRCSVFIWGSTGVSHSLPKPRGPLGSCAYGMATAQKQELGFDVPNMSPWAAG